MATFCVLPVVLPKRSSLSLIHSLDVGAYLQEIQNIEGNIELHHESAVSKIQTGKLHRSHDLGLSTEKKTKKMERGL